MPKIYPTESNVFTTKDWLRATGGTRFSSYCPGTETHSTGVVYSQDDVVSSVREASMKAKDRKDQTKANK